MGIEIDAEFLRKFYGITETGVPENADVNELKKQLDVIINLIDELDKNSRVSKKLLLQPLQEDLDAEEERPEPLGIFP